MHSEVNRNKEPQPEGFKEDYFQTILGYKSEIKV